MTNYPESPREAARAFTPESTDLINNPLYSDVWADDRLSPRDRSIATLAALTVLYRPEEFPAHLRVLRRISRSDFGIHACRRDSALRGRQTKR